MMRAGRVVGGAVARLGYVDGLRALAALYVVALHIYTPASASLTSNAPIFLLVSTLAWGRFAVSAFIVLSGFSLMLPVARKNLHIAGGTWTFYWRRIRRIIPPYYAAIACSLPLIWFAIGRDTGTQWDTSIHLTWSGVAQHLTLINDLTGNRQVSPVFWSIAVECQIYLFFPGFVWLWRRYGPWLATALIVLVSLVMLFALQPTPVGHVDGYALNQLTPQFLGLFGLGMFAAYVTVNSDPWWLRLRAWRGWEFCAVGAMTLFIWRRGAWPAYLLDFCIGIFVVALLVIAARPGAGWHNPIRAALEWRPLVWIGGFSYSLYLIHAPLIQLLWQYGLRPLGLGDTATYLLLLLVGGPLIVIAAWGFSWLFERPFLNTRPASTRRAAPVLAAHRAPIGAS